MLEALVAWLPLAVIFGVFLWFFRVSRNSQRKYIDDLTAMNEENLAINREMIAELREIKEILKGRT